MPEYKLEKSQSHEDMEKILNALAGDGWVPLHYAVQSGSNSRIGWHYVIFTRQSNA